MAETIDDTVLRLSTMIEDSFPDADIAPGSVLSELVVKLAATLQNPIINNIADLDQGNAISDVLVATTDTFNPIIDEIASNYNTTRGAGKKSVGKLKVIVGTSRVYNIRAGFQFFQPTLKLLYNVTTAYRIEVSPTDATELPLIAEGGLFYFIIPVEAADVGSQYQISNKVKFSVADGLSIPDFVDAQAYGNFTSGLPVDTDKELIAKFQEGLTNKSLLSTKSIIFRLAELYPNVRDVSVIGANHAEMTRSKQNLFGISTLGMADVYIRSSFGPETFSVTKIATKNNDGTWQVNLDRSDVPGFYRIIAVVPSATGDGGTLLNTPTFSYTTAGIQPSNTVNNSDEARFTAYQTCSLVIEYNPVNPTITSFDFDILVSYQPNILDIQNLFLDNNERVACADYLIKAALPCYVSVALKLHKKNATVDLPTDLIKQDLYNYINSLKFGEDLYASALVDICHNYDVKFVELPLTLTGSILGIDGSITTITGTDTLSIPTDLTAGISPKTALFFADYFKASSSDAMSESIDIKVL